MVPRPNTEGDVFSQGQGLHRRPGVVKLPLPMVHTIVFLAAANWNITNLSESLSLPGKDKLHLQEEIITPETGEALTALSLGNITH